MTDAEKADYQWLREKASEHSPDCECEICKAFVEAYLALFGPGEEEVSSDSLPSGAF